MTEMIKPFTQKPLSGYSNSRGRYANHLSAHNPDIVMTILSLMGIALLLAWLIWLQDVTGLTIGLALIGLTYLVVMSWGRRNPQQQEGLPQNQTSLSGDQAESIPSYFKEFVDRLPAPAFIKDKQATTIYVNPVYETIFGGGWVGKSVWDFFPEAIAQQMVEADQKVFSDGTKEIIEGVPVPDGTGRLFQTIKFLLYPHSEPVMLAGFAVEITQNHLAEATLERMNAQLNIFNTELEARNRNTQLLLEFSSTLQSCSTLEDIQITVRQFIPKLLPQYAGWVAIRVPEHPSLQIVTTWGLASDCPDLKSVPCHNCWLWQSQSEVWVAQAAPGSICSYGQGEGSVYYTCLPIFETGFTAAAAPNQITAMLHFHLPTKEPIPELALQLARSTLSAINQTLINVNLRQSLHEQSIRDPLTNLFNRRYLQATLTRELARAEREQIAVSLIVIDIDRFKQINDHFGHAAGDVVLQRLGQLLQQHTRQGDMVCRYGGEEFVLVLPTASCADSFNRAEEIRCAFAHLSIDCASTLICATLSVGIAAYPLNGLTADEVFCAADAALYLAKSNGRNQSVISTRTGRSRSSAPFRT